MPQERYFCVPNRLELRQRIGNRNGNPVPDLHRYDDRRVKWARRQGRRVLVMLAGSQPGQQGMALTFDSPELYEQCVRRVFVPTGASRRPASSREQADDRPICQRS